MQHMRAGLQVEAAIRAGDITWHAGSCWADGPVNTVAGASLCKCTWHAGALNAQVEAYDAGMFEAMVSSSASCGCRLGLSAELACACAARGGQDTML